MGYLPPPAVLDRDLRHQGIPILGVSGPPWTVQYDPSATQAQKDQGDSMAAAFDGSEPSPQPRLGQITALMRRHAEMLVEVLDSAGIERAELPGESRIRVRVRDPRVALAVERMDEVRIVRVHVVD